MGHLFPHLKFNNILQFISGNPKIWYHFFLALSSLDCKLFGSFVCRWMFWGWNQLGAWWVTVNVFIRFGVWLHKPLWFSFTYQCICGSRDCYPCGIIMCLPHFWLLVHVSYQPPSHILSCPLVSCLTLLLCSVTLSS